MQTIVISPKLVKPKDNCANLGAPLGILRNIRFQEGLELKHIKVIYLHSEERRSSFAWSRNNYRYRNIISILNLSPTISWEIMPGNLCHVLLCADKDFFFSVIYEV